jgi:Protein of unknown function (DUF1759)
MFTAIIDSDKDLSPIVKFQYLKRALEKEAEETIKEVCFSNDGSDIAKTIFIEKYYRPDVIALNTIQTFLKGNSPIYYTNTAVYLCVTFFKTLYGQLRNKRNSCSIMSHR